MLELWELPLSPREKKKSKLFLLLLSKRDNEHGVCVNKWGTEREREGQRRPDLLILAKKRFRVGINFKQVCFSQAYGHNRGVSVKEKERRTEYRL